MGIVLQTGQSHDAVVLALLTACRAGDSATVRALLAADVVAVFDGEGDVSGAPAVARVVERILAVQPECPMTVESVNGCAGLAYRHEGNVTGVVSFGVENGSIERVWIVLAPEKLRHWQATSRKAMSRKGSRDEGS